MSEIKLDTTELDRIAKALNLNRNAVCRRFAFKVEANAKKRAPVDTSALVNSIYTVTDKDNGYQSASSEVKRLRPKAQTEEHPTPEGNIVARVGPCVEYAEYVEFGTSKMASQPYLGPAVEEEANRFNSGQEWKELFE